ncbi:MULTISPECIES: hypothetical protein [unclassified Nostoc]|jgi:uncharacterized BrkB/YihY/UPF0761 family membrane protein|uniref:hypothetical protein n=1 Tax=unclassified Nostoc TaxID=2593658 RepID=UPI000A38E2CB|nr:MULTISPECIES: hypothetical protein [unclassified Nostoc]OUL24708.1 hypothetical protein BV378_17685 [Nostoc sp. RF31YmG]OUL29263.1 hypothetical protein BV375_15730 [Nostoc sp. 106C]OUL33061.1 hypothetical protein BV372_17950 [Nostoc sp. T09]
MSQRNEILNVFLGIFLLFGLHIIAIAIIFLLGWIYGQIFGYSSYNYLGIWIIGAWGFFIWQMLYVIPLCIWLRRQQRLAMMKGVIIGAVITALLNGTCFLLLFTNR